MWLKHNVLNERQHSILHEGMTQQVEILINQVAVSWLSATAGRTGGSFLLRLLASASTSPADIEDPAWSGASWKMTCSTWQKLITSQSVTNNRNCLRVICLKAHAGSAAQTMDEETGLPMIFFSLYKQLQDPARVHTPQQRHSPGGHQPNCTY